MNSNVRFADLRRLLLDIGFSEKAGASAIEFYHPPSDTIFVFRPYRSGDVVASYNLLDVQSMLDARGLMSAEIFEDQFKKTPA